MKPGPMSSRIADTAVHKHDVTDPSKELPIQFTHPDNRSLRIINSANQTHRAQPAKDRHG
jgi:hypothetical protein